MDNIRLQFPQEFLQLHVTDNVVIRIDSAPEPVNYFDLVALSLGLIEKLAFRPDGRPGYQRDIMAPPSQKLAGNKRILLSTA